MAKAASREGKAGSVAKAATREVMAGWAALEEAMATQGEAKWAAQADSGWAMAGVAAVAAVGLAPAVLVVVRSLKKRSRTEGCGSLGARCLNGGLLGSACRCCRCRRA